MSEHAIALSRRAFIGTAAVAGATCLVSLDPIDAFAVTAEEKKAEAAPAAPVDEEAEADKEQWESIFNIFNRDQPQ